MRMMSIGKTLLVATGAAVAAFAIGYHAGHGPQPLSSLMSELCGNEAPFTAENRVAMRRMMDGMNIEPSGDVDRDFSSMMIAHHLGAIDMAQAELRHGRNELLRRIAQEIVVEQQQEIAAMRLARGDVLTPSAAQSDQSGQPSMLSRPTAVASTIPHS